MGTDNLFHKLRERKEKSFQRQVEWRKVNDVVLVVCQGKRTEPNYLRGLQGALRIQNASLIILETGQGHHALKVVREGIAAYERDSTWFRGHGNGSWSLVRPTCMALPKGFCLGTAHFVGVVLHYAAPQHSHTATISLPKDSTL